MAILPLESILPYMIGVPFNNPFCCIALNDAMAWWIVLLPSNVIAVSSILCRQGISIKTVYTGGLIHIVQLCLQQITEID